MDLCAGSEKAAEAPKKPTVKVDEGGGSGGGGASEGGKGVAFEGLEEGSVGKGEEEEEVEMSEEDIEFQQRSHHHHTQTHTDNPHTPWIRRLSSNQSPIT